MSEYYLFMKLKNMKYKILFLHIVLAYLSVNSLSIAQVGINTPLPKSTLDVTSFNEVNIADGIQAPRLTLLQLTAKGNSLYGANQKCTIIYITDISGGNKTGQRVNITKVGYYYFDGNVWQQFTFPNVAKLGDVINSFAPSDYEGWYLLDGRAITSLPANIQQAAKNLGFATTLPDARDRVLKPKTGTEAIMSTGGINDLAISTANLPNINLVGAFNGSAANNGAHTHAVSNTLAAGGDHSHIVTGTLAAGGAHAHGVSGTLASGGGHTHGTSGTLASAGNHRHTGENIQVINDVDRGDSRGTAALYNYNALTRHNTSSAGAHTHTLSATLTSGGGHTHPVTGTLASADAHAHAIAATLANNGAHTHAISGTLVSVGAHTHTFSANTTIPLGGAGKLLNNRPAYVVVNTFIYLGE